MIEFLTYVVVSVILLIIAGLLIINSLLANAKKTIEELHNLAKKSREE